MRVLATLIFFLPTLAAAQTTTTTPESDGVYSLEERFIAEPKLNRAACDPLAAAAITVDLTYALTPPLYPDDVILRAWIAASADAACTGQVPEITADTYIGDVILTPADVFFTGTTLRVPDELEDEAAETPVLTSTSVLNGQTACAEAGAERTLTLCFALDVNKDGSIEAGDGIQLFDPRAWVRLKLDTIAPGKPASLKVSPRDEALRLTASKSADDEAVDIAAYRAYLRERPIDDTEAAQGCVDWLPELTSTTRVDAGADGNVTFSVNGRNGITYQACIAAIDSSDNEGPRSDVAEGTPQVECDFVECYPDDLLQGGCAAAPSALAIAAALILLVRRRVSRREERAS